MSSDEHTAERISDVRLKVWIGLTIIMAGVGIIYEFLGPQREEEHRQEVCERMIDAVREELVVTNPELAPDRFELACEGPSLVRRAGKTRYYREYFEATAPATEAGAATSLEATVTAARRRTGIVLIDSVELVVSPASHAAATTPNE